MIAAAVAHVTQCAYCTQGQTKAALRQEATPQELMGVIWVAAEMRAGGLQRRGLPWLRNSFAGLRDAKTIRSMGREGAL
jgi:AhpD family alkylhydroperoxidase